jgi:HPt (histidine-containing phosphotransfer) domain-containing protein
MTANALQGDREKALAAGMDDYVAKPVKAEELGEILQRWLSSEEPANGAEDEAIPTSENGDKERALDPAVLESLAELDQDGESGIVAELAGMFLEDAESRLETLRKAVSEDDANSVRDAAHALKGSSGNLGAWQIQEVCSELQEIGESGNLDRTSELLEQLAAALDSARPELLALKERSG